MIYSVDSFNLNVQKTKNKINALARPSDASIGLHRGEIRVSGVGTETKYIMELHTFIHNTSTTSLGCPRARCVHIVRGRNTAREESGGRCAETAAAGAGVTGPGY